MQRLSALFLILLALFIGVPRQACACNEIRQAVSQEHSCCKKESAQQPSCHATASDKAVTKCHSCCGMAANKPIGLANSMSIMPEGEFSTVQVCLPKDQPEFLLSIDSDSPAHQNRAPPRIRGMGTSKTYLYKRTFLI